MSRIQVRLVRWCGVVVLCGVLASLGWAGVGLAADEGQARVRVLVAVPDTPGLDVVLGNGTLVDDGPYRTLGGYQTLTQGSYDLRVLVRDRSTTLLTRTLTFAAPKDYTLIVYGTQGDREISLAVETDSNQPDRGGQARVRFTNLQRGSGAITLATSGAQGITIGEATYGVTDDYTTLAPGTTTLEVRGSDRRVTAAADVSFSPATVVSIFLLGPGDNASGSALLINVDGTGAGNTGGTAGAGTANARATATAPLPAAPTATPRITPTAPPGYSFYATNTPGPGGGQTGTNTGVFPTSTPVDGVRPTVSLGTAATQPNYTPSAALRRAALPVPPCPDNPNCRWYTETNHAVANGFKRFWEANGGQGRWGMPITEEFRDTSLIDGKLRTVQYFERTRLEYFPENRGKAGEVQETSLGREVLRLLGVAG